MKITIKKENDLWKTRENGRVIMTCKCFSESEDELQKLLAECDRLNIDYTVSIDMRGI